MTSQKQLNGANRFRRFRGWSVYPHGTFDGMHPDHKSVCVSRAEWELYIVDHSARQVMESDVMRAHMRGIYYSDR